MRFRHLFTANQVCLQGRHTRYVLVREFSHFSLGITTFLPIFQILINIFHLFSVDAVRPDQLPGVHIVAWANRAGPSNTLYFAVIKPAQVPPRCDLKLVSGNSTFQLANVGLKITVNSGLLYHGGHREYGPTHR